MSRIFIIAGEVSGDTHAAGLIREVLAQEAGAIFTGLGGPRMREAAGSGIEDWVETAGVVGLIEVLKMYRYFKGKFNGALRTVKEMRPDAVVLVDYPGFNLRIAKALRGQRYPGKIIYYISPQVWAWKKGRIKVMAKVLDLMICIFPFEKTLYERSGLRTVFCGHPMVDRVKEQRRNWERERGLIGWFPGSRRNEVKRLFPVMLDAARAIRAQMPHVRFAVAAANDALANLMRQIADDAGMPEAKRWIEVGSAHDLMQRAEVGAVASGTATLEAACYGLPYALIYKVNEMTYLVAKSVVRIEFIGIINVLAGEEVVRELVQHRLTKDSLAAEMEDLLNNQERRTELTGRLAGVVATLGAGGAYSRAAAAVLDCIHAGSASTEA
jgi:lipid-A-disaccharide synthase